MVKSGQGLGLSMSHHLERIACALSSCALGLPSQCSACFGADSSEEKSTKDASLN